MDQYFLYTLFYPISLFFAAIGISSIFYTGLQDSIARKLSLSGLAMLAGFTIFALYTGLRNGVITDHHIFWLAGRTALSGGDPYDRPEFLNPPTAIPIYMLFALLSEKTSFVVQSVLSFVSSALLVRVSHAVIAGEDPTHPRLLRTGTLWCLSTAVAMSVPAQLNIRFGQVALLVTIAFFFAIYWQQRQKNFPSGLAWAIGSIKIGTMFPLLLTVIWRRDTRAIVWMVVCGILLAVATPGPLGLITWLKQDLTNIIRLSGVGEVNDYTSAGSQYHSIVGLDSLFYRVLATENRRLVSAAQFATLGVLGIWIALRGVVWKQWPRGAFISIAALYSSIFLYHRSYDLVVLALPLVFVASQLQRSLGTARNWYWVSLIAICVPLFTHSRMNVGLAMLVDHVPGIPSLIVHIVDAVFIPLPTWLVLAAIASLSRACSVECDTPQVISSGKE